MKDDKLPGMIILGVIALCAIAAGCLIYWHEPTEAMNMVMPLISIATTAVGVIGGMITGERRNVLRLPPSKQIFIDM